MSGIVFKKVDLQKRGYPSKGQNYSERIGTFLLAPDQCTDFFKQDAESALDSRIRGWGAGSRWHVTEDWPQPELSSLTYSLVR